MQPMLKLSDCVGSPSRVLCTTRQCGGLRHLFPTHMWKVVIIYERSVEQQNAEFDQVVEHFH